jgi:hypothetical protein
VDKGKVLSLDSNQAPPEIKPGTLAQNKTHRFQNMAMKGTLSSYVLEITLLAAQN